MTKEEYDKADDSTKEDYIRALNTELLAGDSYDILVLDGLPADSFIEKGILADLSDVLKPMLAEGTMYENILNCYQKKDKIYQVPARIGVNVLMGRSDTSKLTTLQALCDYAGKQPEQSPFGFFTPDTLVDTFLPYQLDSLMGEDGKINRDRLIATLNTLKQLCGDNGLVDNYDKVELRGNNMWNLTSGDYLFINTTKSFLDAMYSFGIMNYVKGSYTSFENSFTPSCEIGIISNGKQLELSKDFLKTLLSEKVQSNDLYDGFPVNPKATLICAGQDRSNYSAATSVTDENGVETMLTFTAIDKQLTQELVELCSKVNRKVTPNERLSIAIKNKAKDFFTGKQTAEAAADAILEEMNIYLSE
jgi:ABC-type glycerol-3-phosphate transport system substrate-binding protein